MRGIISKVLIYFLSVVTEPVSTRTTTVPPGPSVTNEDPLAFLSPEEREFLLLLPPAEQEIILASLTSPRPVTEQEEEKQEEAGDTALDTLHSLALELQNLNFSTGTTEIPVPAPRNAENPEDDREELSEGTTLSDTTDTTDGTTPAFLIESPTLHNSSSITR